MVVLQAYTVLQSPSSTSVTQDDDPRLAEIFLPTFLGSNDQVAPPGKQKGRGAIFRSRREKELCLGIWSELVEEREGEARSHLDLTYLSPTLTLKHLTSP